MLRPYRDSSASVRVGALLCAFALVGCNSGHERQPLADTTTVARLVGVWDVRFHLTSPLTGRDTVGVSEVRGTLGLVQGRWIREVPQLQELTHTGSYDV